MESFNPAPGGENLDVFKVPLPNQERLSRVEAVRAWQRKQRRSSCCLCCATYRATIAPIGHPREPRGKFFPNFRSESSIELPEGVSLATAKRMLLDPGSISAVVLLSPISKNLKLLPTKVPVWLHGVRTGGLAPEKEVHRFTFEEDVPLFGGLWTKTVHVDACQAEIQSEVNGAFEVVYESIASAGVYVRKRRRISWLCDRVHVDELIEGRCSPFLRHLVQREAHIAHQKHVSLFPSLFDDARKSDPTAKE